jgi:predicted DNA-binding protein
MGTVENLGRWLYTRGTADTNGQSSSMQIRLDLTSERHLVQLAEQFGMAKATLAQELLRAAIQDVLRSNPYQTAGDVMSQEDLDEAGLTGDEILKGSDGQPLYRSEW